jgi:hypothetical protein
MIFAFLFKYRLNHLHRLIGLVESWTLSCGLFEQMELQNIRAVLAILLRKSNANDVWTSWLLLSLRRMQHPSTSLRPSSTDGATDMWRTRKTCKLSIKVYISFDIQKLLMPQPVSSSDERYISYFLSGVFPRLPVSIASLCDPILNLVNKCLWFGFLISFKYPSKLKLCFILWKTANRPPEEDFYMSYSDASVDMKTWRTRPKPSG